MESLGKRKAARKRVRLLVEWELGKLVVKGYTTSISLHGMGIQGNRAVEPGSVISMRVSADGRIHNVQGTVRWARQVPPRMAGGIPCRMGIIFNGFGEAFEHFLQKLLAEK